MVIERIRRDSPRRRDVISSHICCFFTDLFSSISSLVCQGYELLPERKRRALAVFFVMLETISFVLDVYGQSHWSIRLAAFLLSLFGFVMTILTFMLERTRVHAEKQLGVVEIGFSVVQLIATFLPVLGIKINNNYTAPVLLLVFAIITAVFTFSKDENIDMLRTLSNPSDVGKDENIDMLRTLSNPSDVGCESENMDRPRLTSDVGCESENIDRLHPPSESSDVRCESENIDRLRPPSDESENIDMSSGRRAQVIPPKRGQVKSRFIDMLVKLVVNKIKWKIE